jgi:plasmid stabilization system protein ParE
MEFKLSYLPTFEADVTTITDHISHKLHNPAAAGRLIDDVEEAILDRRKSPQGYEPIYSKKERKTPYYRIYVRNFTVYYVLIDDVMEVRRLLYSRSNISERL